MVKRAGHNGHRTLFHISPGLPGSSLLPSCDAGVFRVPFNIHFYVSLGEVL